ncbi:MAG: hypothetical protein H8E34_01420 [Bacteroidetes bacterium]|nr:hypothetical protein [Bacteroidota bacterium]MBL6943095.1 hypothetical protein [Bacteroidales bacterium]
MSDKGKNILLWVVAIVLTLALVIYQRSTGPTYPVRGKVTVDGEVIKYKLIRTFGGEQDALVEIITKSTNITGSITQKRFKSHDDWATMEMIREDEKLIAVIPNQPPAGKIEYTITLHSNGIDYLLNEEPAIIRFKGVVPKWVLFPHIFFMFISILFSLRVGLELFFRNVDTKNYTGIVLITLFIGGLILGPFVQKFAFDAYWTGWPFGHDLTDNKTLFTFIFWLIAWFVLRKKPENKIWPLIAVVAMLMVYLIPHSVMGSEIDHTKTENQKNETPIIE